MKNANLIISKKRLQLIINEEIANLKNEAVDHEGVKVVVTEASKLLKAANSFKEKANVVMANSVSPELDTLISRLESMIEAPASFINRPKLAPKVIKLRQTSSDD